MNIDSFYLLIIYACTNVVNISGYELYPFLTYAHFYPSFQQLDVVYDPISSKMVSCPEKCIECEIISTHLICTKCQYGTIFYNDLCVECPENCLDCFDFPLDWIDNKLCLDSETRQYYYYADKKFEKCSDYCLSCENKFICLECQTGYFLKFNNLNNYSCSKCSEFTNCSTCIIANKTQKINSSHFLSIDSLEKFNNYKLKYNWDTICLTCPSKYFKKTDSKCYKCADEIPDCIDCAFISNNQSIEAFGENVIFQNFIGNFFVVCLNCDAESNQFLQIDKTKDILSSKCLACELLVPLCNKCVISITLEEKQIDDLKQMLAYNTSQIFEVNLRIECRECKEKFYVFSENFNYTCLSCPSNCEYCYLYSTILCGRCEENYVLNFFEGQCYPISEFNNITEEYLNSCSRIISENPFVSYFFDSSYFLCQKCRNSSYYPSLNGNCMTCIDPNCEVCSEFGKSETFDTISYTDLLYKSPYLLLGKITEITFVFFLQKCIKCNCMEKNAYNQIYQACCPPVSYVLSTDRYIGKLISGCLNCSSCDLIDSKVLYFGCTKCSKCEDIAEDLLNDELNILSASYLTSFYGKRIYYQLMNEGYMFNATPPFNETDTYMDIYNGLTSQKQVDLVGKLIYKCTPCPINSIDCKVSNNASRIPNPNVFDVESYKFYDLMSYYLVPTKCRNNFVYDYYGSSSRCKFCPNKWRNCKAYKIIEINFIGQNKLFSDVSMVNSLNVLFLYLKNIEFSEFAFICNEFLVKEIEIHILIDIDEEIIWENIYQYSMVIESSLKSRIISLEKYELIFIPKHYDVNTFATIKLGSYITFKGYTSVKFVNIKFKPFYSSSDVTNIQLTPYIEINADSIFLTRCSLIFDQFSSMSKIFLAFSPLNVISFLLIAEFVNIENFEIKNLRLKNVDAIKFLNIYRFFEIQGRQVNVKNLVLEKLIIYNVFSVFYLPTFEGSVQSNFENINIRNCDFDESIFLRIGGSWSMNLNHFYIYNSSFAEKPVVTSLLEIIKDILINDILIEKSKFFGSQNANYLFSLNFFNDVKNLVITDSYFFRTIIFFCIERTILENKTFNFQNIFFFRNVLENFEGKFPFLMLLKFSENLGLALSIHNITLENNLMIVKKKINSFAMIFINVDLILSHNCSFFNNVNVSAIYFENCNSIEYFKFICAKNTSKIDQSQDQIAMRILNAQNSIKLENFYLDSIFSQQGVIILSQEIKYEAKLFKFLFKNSIFTNILIGSFSSASAFFVNSLIPLEIIIVQVEFSNLLLNDESEYQIASTAIYIDSSFSSCNIEKSLFFNGVSNGESNFLRIFVSNLTIIESNMSLANYFNELIFPTKIINQGSFLKALVINLVINSSSFSKAYSLNGGAVYSNFLNKEGSMKINNCSFQDLYSLSEGGALYIAKNNDKNLVVIVTDCTFRHVFALSIGGVFIIKTLKLTQIFIINSFFSNINSAAGSLISGSNFDLKMFFVNISENYNVFSDKNFDFFNGFKDLQFSTLIQIGSIISLRFGQLHFNNCNFYNLSSSTLDNEGTILNCQNCEFYDNGSIYKNIYFWKYAFSLSNAIVLLKKTTFYNFSAYSFSNTILVDGIFLKMNQKSYYPVFILDNSQFNLTEVNVENIECRNCVDGGGFLMASNSIISILLSIFRYNECVFGLLSSSDSNVIINSSFFENNIALQYGGSLSLIECNAFIFNSFFVNGTARKGEGGAIYFYSESYRNFSIINCYFENNIASRGGAVFYKKIAIFLDSLTIFKDNKALLYGDNLYSFPFSLCFVTLNKCEETVPYIKSFRSGASLNYLYLKLLDENGKMIIKYDSSNPIVSMKLVVLNSSSSGNDSLYSMNYTQTNDLQMNQEGIFVVDNLLLIGKQDTDIKIQFSSPQIMYNASLTGFKVIRNYSISLYIHFRKCKIGEYYQEITSTCFLCLEGTYSYNPLVEGCNNCPPGLNCSGGAETIVLPNFWRSKKLSEKNVYCSMNPVNCLGGKESNNDLCLNGHIGARCESCDLMGRFWNSSFSRTPNYGCIECDQLTYNYAVLIFLSLFNFFSMILSIKGTISNINTRLKLRVIKTLARYGMFDIKINESSIYLKIYFSYLQIIQVVTNLNLNYPSWVNIPGSTFGAPTNSVLYSLDCMVSHIITTIPYVHVKLIVALLVPFLYLIIFVFGYLLFMRKSKYHHKYSMLYTVCLFTLLYFQPSIVDNIISVLSCVQVGDDKYIKADVAYECSGEEYHFYSIVIGIPSLFFWGVGTPLSILFRLIKERKHLKNITNQIRYGYIYDEYDLFYWEFVRMYEKILIVIILSFFESEILIKGLLVLFIIFTYSLLLFKNNPYKSKKLNRTDKINSIVCYLSIFLGLLTYHNSYDIMIALSYSLMLAINVFFNFFMLKNIFFSMAFALLRRLRKDWMMKYFFNFKRKKGSKWLTVRRLVGRYLREKERVKLMRLRRIKTEEEKYKLSIIDYNPNKLITKQKEIEDFKKKKKSNNSSFDEGFSELAITRGEIKTFISNNNSKN